MFEVVPERYSLYSTDFTGSGSCCIRGYVGMNIFAKRMVALRRNADRGLAAELQNGAYCIIRNEQDP